jgi:hypothetical protein
MKKKVFNILTAGGILTSALTFTLMNSQNTNATNELTLDKTVIQQKKHVNIIKELLQNSKPEEKTKKVNQYLSGLNDKQLLETAAEIALETNDYNSYILISKHFKDKFKQDPPYNTFANIIKDKGYKDLFRTYIMDISTKLGKGKTNPPILDSLVSVATDNTEKDYVRRYALLQLEFNDNDVSKETKEHIHSKLNEILNSANEPAEVQGAAITAMRRTHHPDFEQKAQRILDNAQNYPEIVVRHAVVNIAKTASGHKYISKLKTIAENTENNEVLGSTIYALGLIGDKDAIKAIISNKEKVEETEIRASLKRNEDTIISMLDVNNEESDIVTGIKAAKILKYETFIEPLLLVLSSNKVGQETKELAQETLNIIKENPVKPNIKWEVD